MNVKLLISYHAPSTLLKSDVFVPIHVGRALRNKASKDGVLENDEFSWLSNNMIGDNTGDNISDKNRIYAEITAQYWAWKNQESLDCPEYIGFMHYRRHFMFKKPNNYKDNWSATNFDRLDEQYLKDIDLNDDTVKSTLQNYDGIVYKSFNSPITVYEQFKELIVQPWDLDASVFDSVINIIKDKYPHYIPALTEYLNGKKHYWMNMFIFKTDIFNEYMDWLFDILFEAEKNIDFSKYSVQGKRVLAYICERLLGIFITYKKELNLLELPVSQIENTKIVKPIFPTFKSNNIPVIFSSDDNYSKYLVVVINSLIESTVEDYNYDIYVLNDGISNANLETISSLNKNKKNISIKFIDVNDYIPNSIKEIFYINEHFSIATYFRFFIEFIFENFEKVLYLDTDIIIQDDVSKLYNIDIGDKPIGACRDYEIMSHSKENKDLKKYINDTLQIDDVSKYFQAGILIMNINKFKECSIYEKLIEKLKEIKEPKFVDQDILNSVLYGQVVYLPLKWNFVWFIEQYHKNLINLISEEFYNEFIEAKKSISIIHYAGKVKPWNNIDFDLSNNFWLYARKTPVYENLLLNLTKRNIDIPQLEKVVINENDIFNNFRLKNYSFFKNKLFNFLCLKHKIRFFDKVFIKNNYAFDAVYYLNEYPDVKFSGMDPLSHYVKYGWHEGRNPNSWFNTKAYLFYNADIAKSKVNPLSHYITYGKNEGRKCTW